MPAPFESHGEQIVFLLYQILDELKAIRATKDAEEDRAQESIDQQDRYESRRSGDPLY